jgi:hypothetical protein
MRPLSLVVLLSLVACSDYSLNGKGGPDGLGGGDSGWDVSGDTDGDTASTDDSGVSACDDQEIPGGPATQVEACEPGGSAVGTFTPVVEWIKQTFTAVPGSNQVMMMPAVGSLTDDNGDGKADENDTPDIVFITYGSANVIRVVSGVDGTEELNIRDDTVQGQGGVALGDLDGDGWTDIVAATLTGLVAYDHTGARMWTNSGLTGHIYGTCDNPAIADMDGDGSPEVVLGNAIVSATGATVGAGKFGIAGVEANNVGTVAVPADLDGDGQQEVVTGNALYRMDGSAIWHIRAADGYVAVGNFDADPKGEIVVTGQGQIRLIDDDGTVLCSNTLPGASAEYGGPPTVADFDGDGEPEFAAAAGSRYSVFEKDCSVKWTAKTQDASSGNTGSSVFDFEGDGAAEAVYGDETRLWVFAGADGSVKLSSTDHSNATWLEYPIVADVDGDDQAEIVVANTSYTSSIAGITVIGDADASWRPGRRIWNQHAYSITNVNDDGSIPRTPAQNWLTYNNFRSGDLSAAGSRDGGPDLQVSIEDVCLDACAQGEAVIWVAPINAGYVDVSPPVTLELFGEADDGTRTLLATRTITDPLPAGQRLAALQVDVADVLGFTRFVAAIDGGDNARTGVVSECVEDDNEAAWLDVCL